MLQIDKKFSVDDFYNFFNNIIGFEKYVEVRIFDLSKKYPPFSRYAASVNDLIRIMKRYNDKRWLLYYGINTRPNESGKNLDVVYRKVFYFDIESSGEKPPLSDEGYVNDLFTTVSFISDYLNDKYAIKPCALAISGRGLHLYYKHLPIDNLKYKTQFRTWYKSLQEEMDAVKPCKNIKFLDSVFDGSRIASLPGSYNWKYPETPFRNLLFANNEVFDLKPFLDKIIVKKFSSIGKVYDSKLKFTDETIRESPEYKLLSNYDALPEGKRHCHLAFAFQLLCRDCNITIMNELYDELVASGYDGGELVFPSDEYVYNKNIVNNWCIENYEWCVLNDFRLPYTYAGGVYRPFFKLNGEVNFGDIKLETFEAIVSYVKQFNSINGLYDESIVSIYYDCLMTKLKNNCNEYLFRFITDNNLLMQIITLK
jgi:hypothetical protein